MSLTATETVRSHRSPALIVTVVLLILLGIGAVGGGLAMILGIGGESVMPDAYLDALPLVDSWLVPGLILLAGFGIGSLAVAYGVARRPHQPALPTLEAITGHHWSWLGTILLGIGQMVWIALELVSIPFSPLMGIFGTVGLALAILPFSPGVREYLRSS